MPVVGKRLLYGALGLITTGLGILGVWLPGLPTTPFILVALWAFANSSQRLYDWLTRLPLLKHAIHEAERFQREGTISPRVKLIAQGSAWLSCLIVTLLTHNLALCGVLALAATACSVCMLLIPSAQLAPEEVEE